MTTNNPDFHTHYVSTTTTSPIDATVSDTPWHGGLDVGQDRPDFNADLKYPRIIRYVVSTPWAMEPTRLADVLDVLRFKALGGQLSKEEIREYCGVPLHRFSSAPYLDYNGDLAALGNPSRRGAGSAVAVIPLRGIISHHISQVQDISGPGGTSVEAFRNNLRQALASREVGSVVIDIDSPGGSVEGVQEMADEVRDSRGDKPIVAVANGLAASAAFWIASAADQVSVIPSGQVGSIGVFSAHEDVSAALEAEGVKVTLIHAGKFKTEGNPFEPLSDEAREHIQSRVDATFATFLGAVAAGRGTTADVVKKDFGQGRLVDAQQALAAGMVDHVETLEQAINRMRTARPQSAARAETSLRRFSLAFK